MKTQIKLNLFANFTKFHPHEGNPHSIKSGTTVQALMNELDLPEGVPVLIVIDGHRCKPETKLKGGETVNIFPPIRGG
ncbi:MAG: MoaD/ThiS family protein [Deltaproteobacteria bacterium]|jgi:sulfur carrier protein ThiS|nr:MoaD/ThiS family protein [Deltaproteobacteria bacterium]